MCLCVYLCVMVCQVWDPSTGMVMSTFRNHLDTVTCCAISSNGTRAVSSSEDNTVKVSIENRFSVGDDPGLQVER